MASNRLRPSCIKCATTAQINMCVGCQQWFCPNHRQEHQDELAVQMSDATQGCEALQQVFSQQYNTYHLSSRINQWEQKSVEAIRKVAAEARLDLQKRLDRIQNPMQTSLSQLHKNLQSSYESNDYTETKIKKWTKELENLREKFQKPPVIDVIDNDRTQPLIYRLQLKEQQKKNSHIPNINSSARWARDGITVAGGNGKGNESNQLCDPRGLCVDDDQTLYIADYGNHRIMEWKRGATSGRVAAGGNGLGNHFYQLHFPTDVLIDKETNDLLICDYGNQRVMKWARQNCMIGKMMISNINSHGLAMDINGVLYNSDYEKEAVIRYKNKNIDNIIEAGGNGTGNLLNQLSYPTYIFIDAHYSIYVSDTRNHRVVKWATGAKEGIVVAGGRGEGNDLCQLSYPKQIIVDSLGAVYIADSGNHRVIRWYKNATCGTVIAGGNNPGKQANLLKFPWGLSFDRHGNLYVADWGNNRVQRFNMEGM